MSINARDAAFLVPAFATLIGMFLLGHSALASLGYLGDAAEEAAWFRPELGAPTEGQRQAFIGLGTLAFSIPLMLAMRSRQ